MEIRKSAFLIMEVGIENNNTCMFACFVQRPYELEIRKNAYLSWMVDIFVCV